MIPKMIHYCWFGGGPLPKLALRCLESWKKNCPDYKIARWDESNLDLACNQYVKQAAKAKKWSLVTDFFRFKIIHERGGIYLDTDVELLRPLDDLLDDSAYMGIESTGFVNTGSGFGAEAGHPLLQELISAFESAPFSPETPAIFSIMTKTMRDHGYVFNNRVQRVGRTTIYPKERFAPIDLTTRKLHVTKDTYSIHHYSGSWAPPEKKRATLRRARYCRIFGDRLGLKVDGVTTAIMLDGGVLSYAKNRLPKWRVKTTSVVKQYGAELVGDLQTLNVAAAPIETTTTVSVPMLGAEV